MAKFLNECWDSADWVEEVSAYRPTDDIISLAELGEISEDASRNGGLDGLPNHWDYPLSETEMLATDEDHKDQTYVLVRFDDGTGYGGYEYRWCEID